MREKVGSSTVGALEETKSKILLRIKKRRLLKEHKFDEPLSSESMIKAMIIRLGEMGKPFINYEVIDFSIRSFFSYLGINKYVRVDRETEFLRRLELKIAEILKKLVK